MFAASFIALALAIFSANAQLVFDTPGVGLIECQDFQFFWTGNVGPVQILVYPTGVSSGMPLETLPTVSGGSTVTWTVDVPANVSYTFALHDLGSGQTVFTAAALVAPNPFGETSCEGKNTQGALKA